MAANPELKRAVLRLVVGVAAVDALFIAIWLLARIATRPEREQMMFVAVWTVATLAVVLPSLGAVRRVVWSSTNRRSWMRRNCSASGSSIPPASREVNGRSPPAGRR
ncbi:MAG: hypothetical protein ACYC3Q_13610 [Gemmatimonadaceae bacterium]